MNPNYRVRQLRGDRTLFYGNDSSAALLDDINPFVHVCVSGMVTKITVLFFLSIYFMGR